jgi:hypothetical protein
MPLKDATDIFFTCYPKSKTPRLLISLSHLINKLTTAYHDQTRQTAPINCLLSTYIYIYICMYIQIPAALERSSLPSILLHTNLQTRASSILNTPILIHPSPQPSFKTTNPSSVQAVKPDTRIVHNQAKLHRGDNLLHCMRQSVSQSVSQSPLDTAYLPGS